MTSPDWARSRHAAALRNARILAARKRRDRPEGDIQAQRERRGAASAVLPFVDSAAFPGGGRQQSGPSGHRNSPRRVRVGICPEGDGVFAAG